jgi:hypothetical protein
MDNEDLCGAVLDLTPATLHQLVTAQAAGMLAQHLPQVVGIVRVTGHISDPGPARSQWHYGVKLSGSGSQIEVALPANLVVARGIAAGQCVRVTGLLRPRVSRLGALELRIEAGDIERCDAGAHGRIEEGGRITLDRLKSLPVRRFPFPVVSERLRIALIRSSSANAQVAQDCVAELAKLGRLVTVGSIRINMLDPVSIADAVNRAEGDIVMIVRGGGVAADFEVFDDPRVVSALAAKRAYRVVGLGHSGNATMLDLVADHSARTPAQAGLHVREKVEENLRQWRATKKLLQRVEQQQRSAQSEWATANPAMISYWWIIAAFVVGMAVAAAVLK